MAAAAVSRASVSRFQTVPGSLAKPCANAVALSPCMPALHSNAAQSTRKIKKVAMSSSFWGQTAAFCSNRVCQRVSDGSGMGKRRSGGALQTQAVSQETASIWTAVYGLLLLGGGTSAYLRSGSKQSVISGAVGAALSAVAYYLESQEATHQTGLAVAFGYSLLFASVFGIRLFATKKAFPAAPLLALSLASAFVFASAYNA